MKTAFLFPVFFLFSFFATAQDADSLAVAREVDSLIQVSRALTGQRDFEKALEVNAIAEKIALEKFGRESVVYGNCCFNRGRVNYVKTDYPEVEKWYLESKTIREKILGKEHPGYTATLNNLAALYYAMGNFGKAEQLILECKTIREKILGKEHPDYVATLNNLAALYTKMGNFGKAEQLILECKTIREKILGKEHPDYAATLNNLAALYIKLGNFGKAEPVILECKTIREKILGKEHPDYAATLNNLAALYYDMGNYEKTEPLYLNVKSIREKNLGKGHPDYASSLFSLANLYYTIGNYEKAEQLLLECKTIREKALGIEHPDYANTLTNLGALCTEMGNYGKAEQLFLECKAIQEKALGLEHPDYANTLTCLVVLYTKVENIEKAEAYYEKLSKLNQHLMSKALHYLSDGELNTYLSKVTKSQYQLLSLVQLPANHKSGISQTCYDNTLFFKGFLLSAANQIKRLTLSDSTTTEKYKLLKSRERRLADLYAKPIAERDNVIVAELENQSNDLEKDLARTVAGFGEAIRQVRWQDVQQNLKANEASMEFVHFRYDTKNQTDSTLYAALLLLPGTEQPTFITLFEEKPLNSLLTRNTDRNELYVKRLYTLADRSAKPLDKPQKTLYDLLWKPLEKELANVNTIYFSPSGLLHRLNLAAIPVGLDSVLGDRYHLVELGSTRQLVIPATVEPAANDAVLFGGIAYEADSTALFQAYVGLDSLSIASRGELSFAYTDSTLRVGTWSALSYTDREVSSVEKTLKTAGFQSDTRRGFAATEEAFKTLGAGGKTSPRVLHLATHGFFFPDPKSTSARFQTSPTFGATEPIFKISDHPMIRSGLILAGGNHAWATGKPIKPGMEDGILTAYEISQMNLSNTELVVLSACETGLGDIEGNEGVYGLQRAFKIAGAKYLIMSLWQVPDKQTSLLMTTFYKKWLEEKMEIPAAFRAAQRELREAGLDPYQWAGFVLVE